MDEESGPLAYTDDFRPSPPLARAQDCAHCVHTTLCPSGPSLLALNQSAYMLSTSSLRPVQRLEKADLFSPNTPSLPSSGMLATEGLHQAPTPTMEPQQPIDLEKSDQEWKEMLYSNKNVNPRIQNCPHFLAIWPHWLEALPDHLSDRIKYGSLSCLHDWLIP